MSKDLAYVILCWKRPDKLHTLKFLKELDIKNIYFAIDNADSEKERYIAKAKEYKIKYFTFDKDINVSDQMFNNKLKSGAVCTRKIVENIMREKGIKYFLVLDDDYTQIENVKGKKIKKETLERLNEIYIDILEKIPFVYVMSLAQNGECVGGKEDFYHKSKFKIKAMNYWFCSTDKPVDYAGIMNDDVNAGILLNKYGHLSIQYGGLFIQQAMQASGGMKDVYAQNSAMYQKAMFSIMLAPSFVKLNYLCQYGKNGSQSKRIYHNISREYGYPYVVEV